LRKATGKFQENKPSGKGSSVHELRKDNKRTSVDILACNFCPLFFKASVHQ